MKSEGKIDAAYWYHGHDDTTQVWIINADSNEEMWSVVSGYPAGKYFEINLETNILADAVEIIDSELEKVKQGMTGARLF